MAKWRAFLTRLRKALTIRNLRAVSKFMLAPLAILIVAAAFYLLLHHYVPEEKLKEFAKYGYLGVFLVTFFSSLTVLLPVPGTVVVIAAAQIWNTALVALVASVGGSLGEISGYFVGYVGRAIIAPEHTQRYQMAERLMKRYGGLAISLFAFVPFLIFDFVGIAAGVFRYPVKKFLFFTWLGRLPRSFIECYAGASLLSFIAQHLPF